MTSFLDALRERVLIFDGAVGTNLQLKDLTADDFTSQTQQTSLLQEQIKNAGLNTALNVRAVLTPDQLAQAAQIKSQMQALWAQMHSSSQGQ